MNVNHAGVEPTDMTFALVGIAKLQSLLLQRCLTSGCMGHVIKEETRVTVQGINTLDCINQNWWSNPGATITFELSCSENHKNRWASSDFYNSPAQVIASTFHDDFQLLLLILCPPRSLISKKFWSWQFHRASQWACWTQKSLHSWQWRDKTMRV